jgi:hypothetical protein
MIKYILPFILAVLTSCASVEPVESKEKVSSMEDYALSEYGEKYAILENSTGSHTIVFKKYKELKDLFPTVKFFIYEEESKSVIFQDELNAGSVKWYSDFKIVATSRNVKSDENQEARSVYYYDVLEQKKVDE